MRSRLRSLLAGSSTATTIMLVGRLVLQVASGLMVVRPALGDGCFVFKWDKKTDINEPTQKAIIVFDGGREDLLLQVKYEGSLEDFGWLIPVPAMPEVQLGSMQPFYELSQLSQRRRMGMASYGMSGQQGPDDGVRVINVKTVGAYEVATLSAQNKEGLTHWLHVHEYSIPDGKNGLIEGYIRQGWYFIAARIQLNRGVAFRQVSATSPNERTAPANERTLQRQLSSGELHPLMISFDTPRCIFPLKISSMNDKPSEVSLYVLSAEPLLEKTMFDRAVEKLRQQKLERDRTREQREQAGRKSMRNVRALNLAFQMYSLTPVEKGQTWSKDWTVEDLEAIAEEGEPNSPLEPFDDDDFYFPSQELLQCFSARADQIPKCANEIPRLRNKTWYLTKQVYAFRPEEMADLEFQRAEPVLKAALPSAGGRFAAGMLSTFGGDGVPFLLSACKSSNTGERVNASTALAAVNDPQMVETLLSLLKDDSPQVRYHAIMATAAHWDSRFVEPLQLLLRDPHPVVRQQASQWLGLHETADCASVYISLLRDPDPNARFGALRVLSRINPASIPRADLLHLLSSPQLEAVSLALNLLQGRQSTEWGGPGPHTVANSRPTVALSSADVAPLVTNQFTMIRLRGLQVLRQNGDAKAVELTLPLLRDTNSLVRNRAFAFLRTATGQQIPQNDPAQWDQWWEMNKRTFTPALR